MHKRGLTKLNGGLSRLHSADEDAVSSLTIAVMVNDRHIEEEAWRMPSRSVRLSVCLSVTFVHSVETNEHILKKNFVIG